MDNTVEKSRYSDLVSSGGLDPRERPQKHEAPCVAGDGKTPVITLRGYPLMVPAHIFNGVVGERNRLQAELLELKGVEGAPPKPDFKRIEGMLTAYVECIKSRGDVESWHYIPEIEEAIEEVRAYAGLGTDSPVDEQQKSLCFVDK
jgi:hypothetical protein